MDYFITRQPVFDNHIRIFAYELLYRKGFENTFFDGYDKASSNVIQTGLLTIGMEELIGSKKALIKFTHNLLLKEVAFLFPKDKMIIEIPQNIQPDEKLLKCCLNLKKSGYQLVFGDFTLDHINNPVLHFVDVVKINSSKLSLKEKIKIREILERENKILFASNIGNVSEFNHAISQGFTWLQGDFFDKPITYSTKEIPGHKLNYIRFLREIYKSDANFDEIEKIIKQDVSLSYSLLKLINSAFYGLTSRVQSIKHACLLLGFNEIKKWFSLVALSSIAQDKPEELIVKSVFRAKFCESVAPLFDLEEESAELYLMGLFSLIDAILDKPIAVLLSKLPFPEQVNLALLGINNSYRKVYDIILAYEKGNWQRFSELASQFQVDEDKFPKCYSESLKWSNQVFDL